MVPRLRRPRVVFETFFKIRSAPRRALALTDANRVLNNESSPYLRGAIEFLKRNGDSVRVISTQL